ncbi:MAG: hypothetical protein HN726_04960, partial [Candidatus Magasanikbacteria bacterium]|nr:hypothetical protein [Candidatus Magasanikbacteria bacterium]
MRYGFAVAVFALACPSLALAGGGLDGEWTGTLTPVTGKRDHCGFDQLPFDIRVDGDQFVAVGTDIVDRERKFEGDIGDAGRVDSWSPWTMIAGGSGEPHKTNGHITGAFADNSFNGRLDASTSYGICTATIALTREGTVPSASSPYAGEWVGHVTAPMQDSSCKYDRIPIRAEVRGNRFVAYSTDVSKKERKVETDIDDEGIIDIWVPWAVYSPQGGYNESHVGDGQFKGAFSENQFTGSLYVTGKWRAACAAKIVMTRVGSEVASGNAGAERQRLAAEVARLKAEAERGKLEQEVARLKAEAVRPAASTSASRPTDEAETALWNEVRDARTVDEMQRYLEAYPAGEYAPLALARIRQLAAAEAQRAELTLWNQVKGSKDAAGFKRYVAAYPDGLFVDVAKARILSLDSTPTETAAVAEETVWRSIDGSRKAGDYKNYLKKYPDGRFRKQAKAGIQVAEKFAAIKGIDFGDYHALIIGNNAYKTLPPLKTAVGDAQAVARALKSTYGFKVKLLTDASRNDIIDALDTYVETLTERDNLLIYYAGHGWLSEDAGRGYWLPVDAKKNRRSNWISNATVTDTLKAVQAKHVMVVADSCYSGTLTRGAGVALRTADYWKRMVSKRARVVLSSGGLEPVADSGGGDHSPFAQAFIDTLAGNDAIIDGTQLFTKMRRPVMVAADQTPEYSDARNAGHEGGDFLFV